MILENATFLDIFGLYEWLKTANLVPSLSMGFHPVFPYFFRKSVDRFVRKLYVNGYAGPEQGFRTRMSPLAARALLAPSLAGMFRRLSAIDEGRSGLVGGADLR